MGDPAAEFFSRLSQNPLAEVSPRVRATIRFDLVSGADTQHWFVDIENGVARVSQEEREADCVIYGDKASFDRIAEGEDNVLSAQFRNELGLAGNAWLMTVVRKLLPGPSGARDPGRSSHRHTGEGQ